MNRFPLWAPTAQALWGPLGNSVGHAPEGSLVTGKEPGMVRHQLLPAAGDSSALPARAVRGCMSSSSQKKPSSGASEVPAVENHHETNEPQSVGHL